MYTNVHMTMTVSITDFRNNIFKYTSLMLEGYEFEVEKGGRKVFKTVKVVDDSAAKARNLLKILKKYKGKFPNWDINVDKMRHNKAEREYSLRYYEKGIN